jgi:hypothetical protein
MRIKLQNASGSDLPAYNPILPPQAITQILVVSNPNQVNYLFCIKNFIYVLFNRKWFDLVIN